MYTYRLRKAILSESPEAVAAFTALTLLRSPAEKVMNTLPTLCYALSGCTKKNRSLYDKVSKGVNQLIDSGIITAERDGANVVYDPSQTDCGDDFFIMVTQDEIWKVIGRGECSFLHFYLILLSTINTTSKYGNQSVQYLADLFHSSANTAMKYISQLEALNLIRVHRSGNRQNNHYCRYQDSEVLDFLGKSKVFNSRSLKQKYNQVMKGKHYSYEEMNQIRDYAEKHGLDLPDVMNPSVN